MPSSLNGHNWHRWIAVAVAAGVATTPALIVKFDLLTSNKFALTSKFWILLHLYGLPGYLLTYLVLYLVIGWLGAFLSGKMLDGAAGAFTGAIISNAILAGSYVPNQWITVVVTAGILACFALAGGLLFQKAMRRSDTSSE